MQLLKMPTDIETPTISFTPLAFAKMMMLVEVNDKEVGWHGTVERQNNNFVITDIFVYPQVVTRTTVEPSQEEYNEWQTELPDDIHNSLRFHGHSHVNMGTSASSVDAKFQEDIVKMIDNTDFYIFMIINKKGDFNIYLYDGVLNLAYKSTSKDTQPEITLNTNNIQSFGKILCVSPEVYDTLMSFKEELNDMVTEPKRVSYSYYEYPYNYGNTGVKSQSSIKLSIGEIQDIFGVAYLDAKDVHDELSNLVHKGAITNDRDSLIEQASLYIY